MFDINNKQLFQHIFILMQKRNHLIRFYPLNEFTQARIIHMVTRKNVF